MFSGTDAATCSVVVTAAVVDGPVLKWPRASAIVFCSSRMRIEGGETHKKKKKVFKKSTDCIWQEEYERCQGSVSRLHAERDKAVSDVEKVREELERCQSTLGKLQLQQEKTQQSYDKAQNEVDRLQERLDKALAESRKVS